MENKETSGVKTILIMATIGIWSNLIFNVVTNNDIKEVKITNGVRVYGAVEIEGGEINVGNTVDINLQEINGKKNAFYKDYDGDYILIPVISK